MPTNRNQTLHTSAAHAQRARRNSTLTFWVAVSDVMEALACGRSTAYEHLRRAAGRRRGERGLLRVAAPVWERYAAENI